MKRIRIDNSLCTGCRICELVCSSVKTGTFNLYRSGCRTTWVNEILPNTPKFCIQCKNPKCVEVCPADALSIDSELGYISLNEEKCIKCGKCITACPFDSMFRDELTLLPVKCDTCKGEPRCVEYCHSGALTYK